MSGFLTSLTSVAVKGANKIGSFLGIATAEGFVSQSDDATAVVNNPAVAEMINKVKMALLGGKEPFVTQTQGTTHVNTASIAEAGGMLMFYSTILMIFVILFCYGAARTSYCYNIAIGNGVDIALLYSVICFFFPNLYYPYYALFLNPLCISKGRGKK